MRKLLLLAVLGVIAGCFVSCSDKADEPGPAGSPEMLYGTWGATHVIIDSGGRTTESDIDPSAVNYIFCADGTAFELTNLYVSSQGVWSYDPSTRLIRFTEQNSGEQMNWYVSSLTERELVIVTSSTVEGVSFQMTVFLRLISRDQTKPL